MTPKTLFAALLSWSVALLMVAALVPAVVLAAPLTTPVSAVAPAIVQGEGDDDEGGDVGDDYDDSLDDDYGDGLDDDNVDDDYVAPPPQLPVATIPVQPAPVPTQPVAPVVDPNDDDEDDGGDDDGIDADDDLTRPSSNDDDIDEVQPTATAVSEDDDDDDDDDIQGLDRPVADQAILKLGDDVDPYRFTERTGTTLIRVILSGNIVQIELDPDQDDAREFDRLADDEDVVWAELNYTAQAPEGRPRYFFTSTDGTPRLVDGPALPDGLAFTPTNACVTGDNVTVAVLDTGIDEDHPLFQDRVAPGGINLLDAGAGIDDVGNDRDDDGDDQVDEMVGHGTHVSGTILQVAPDAVILPVKVLDSDGVGDAFALTAGIIHAVNVGADVVNLSLGSTYDSLAVQAGVAFAEEQGVVVVAAAGNGDRDQPIEYPAGTSSVISVASTTAEGDKAGFSNFNAGVDLSAPGVDIASAYPDGLYATASGTSMSTPLVAGTVALIKEIGLGSDPGLYATILTNTSGPFDLSDESLVGSLGAGVLDIDSATTCSTR